MKITLSQVIISQTYTFKILAGGVEIIKKGILECPEGEDLEIELIVIPTRPSTEDQDVRS